MRTKLEEPVSHAARVWQAEVRSVLGQELNESSVVGEYVDWPRLDFRENPRVEVLDCVGHSDMLAQTLTARLVMPNV